MDYEEEHEDYDPDLFDEFGEGFEDDFDVVGEKVYEKAFEEASLDASLDETSIAPMQIEEEINEDDYEFDSIVGGRDKKPVLSLLNKGKLSKYEMDDLLNTIDD